MTRSFVTLAALTIVASAARAQEPVTGVVTDSSGRGVLDAYVIDRTTGRIAVANGEGIFRLNGVPAGQALDLGIRRIGYRPLDTTLVATGGEIRLMMRRAPAALDTIRVVSRSAGEYDEFLDRNGFYARMNRHAGGGYIQREEIERRNTGRLTALLRDVPGVRIMSRPGRAGRNDVPLGRLGCPLRLVLDGRPVEIAANAGSTAQSISTMRGNVIPPPRELRNPTSEAFDDVIQPHDVAAIEVYPSATAIPSELAAVLPVGSNCGMVAVWTYYGKKANIELGKKARSP